MNQLVNNFFARRLIAITFLLSASSCLASPPLLVAHRGASGDAPENTLPAFQLAWEQGADAIEGDFHLTSDGQIICLHDANTKITCGVHHLVAETDFTTLRKLDAGKWFHKKFTGTQIPTLEEVIATIPSEKKLYLEVKCGPKIVTPLIKVLENSQLKTSQLVVISFQAEVIAAIEKMKPEWKTCLLTSIKGESEDSLKPSINEILATLKRLKCDGISTSANTLITKTWITEIRDAGFEYHAWTINESKLAKKFLENGAQSITTDFPQKLSNEIK